MRYPEVRMPDFNGDRDKFDGFWRELFEKRIEESSITSVSVKLGIGDQFHPAANRKYCHFCQRQGHRNLECLTFRSPSDRRQCNKSRNCCWKCFSADHTSNNCNRPNCNICGKNHSRLPCLETDLTTPLKANDQNQ
uniref:CCHC-type domain-containing protein n=1 Tax=Heterorhabditis bacteriophora TaxID=37862 RepID=A0A1I7X2N8_HETBA